MPEDTGQLLCRVVLKALPIQVMHMKVPCGRWCCSGVDSPEGYAWDAGRKPQDQGRVVRGIAGVCGHQQWVVPLVLQHLKAPLENQESRCNHTAISAIAAEQPSCLGDLVDSQVKHAMYSACRQSLAFVSSFGQHVLPCTLQESRDTALPPPGTWLCICCRPGQTPA